MNGAWWFVGLATATPSPSPTPGLREGLDESVISPGLAGFLAVFGIALVSLVLFYSLSSKLRGVKYRGELDEAREADAASAPAAPAPLADAGSAVPEAGPAVPEAGMPDDGAPEEPSDRS